MYYEEMIFIACNIPKLLEKVLKENCRIEESCEKAYLDWLKQPVEERNHVFRFPKENEL